MMALLTDQLKAWIGREAHYRRVKSSAGRRSATSRWRSATRTRCMSTTSTHAKRNIPVIVPPTLVCETCQYAHRRPRESG